MFSVATMKHFASLTGFFFIVIVAEAHGFLFLPNTAAAEFNDSASSTWEVLISENSGLKKRCRLMGTLSQNTELKLHVR